MGVLSVVHQSTSMFFSLFVAQVTRSGGYSGHCLKLWRYPFQNGGFFAFAACIALGLVRQKTV